jgi:hypothetical protein
LADYIISNVIDRVLIQQIVKLNDPPHRVTAQSISDSIVSAPADLGLLTDFINKCDEENNGPDVLNRREFVLTTAVQYTPTSEFIIYNFRSAPQGVSVEEVAQ